MIPVFNYPFTKLPTDQISCVSVPPWWIFGKFAYSLQEQK